MKKIVGLFLAFFLLYACFDSVKKDTFQLNLTLSNFSKGLIYLEKETINGSKIVDSIDLKGNNKHSFKGNLTEPTMFYISIAKRGKLPVFVENDQVIDLNINAQKVEIKSSLGSKTDSIYRKFYNTAAKRNSLINQAKTDLYIAEVEHNYLRLDSLKTRINFLKNAQQKSALRFAFRNKESVVSPYVAVGFLHQIKQSILDSLYQAYPNNIKESNYGKEFKSYLDFAKSIKIEQTLPSITIAEKSYPEKEKYNLFYFWETTNSQSYSEVRFLNEWVKKQSDKVSIVLLSPKNQSDEVMKLFDRDKITLLNVGLKEGLNNPIAQHFSARFLPFSLLTNPDGKIIAYNTSVNLLKNLVE